MNSNPPDFKALLDAAFEPIVGQNKAKSEIKEHLDCYLYTRQIPHLLIVAPKGQGKTTLSKAIGKGLYEFNDKDEIVLEIDPKNPTLTRPKRKDFHLVNCASLGNSAASFVNLLLLPKVQGKDVTIFFDEAHKIPEDVSTGLLSLLNPNAEGRNVYDQNGYLIEVDFSRQTFIFATTEPQKMLDALKDRLERVSLEDYSLSELGQIVKIGLGSTIQTSDEVLLAVADVLRGNARDGQKMAQKIKNFLRGRTEFTIQDWDNFKKVFNILPLGLNGIELGVLRLRLAENMEGTSLTSLSAKTGMTREALRQDTELFLQKYGLMEIDSGGRQITTKGLLYLRELDNPTAA